MRKRAYRRLEPDREEELIIATFFTSCSEYLKSGDLRNAQLHLREAVARDPGYSAAWKLLGKALADDAQPQAALDAWRQGIAVAEKKGDQQAAREMNVFARRIEKQLESSQPR